MGGGSDMVEERRSRPHQLTTVERDQFSKYGWAVIIKNKTGATVVRAFKDILADNDSGVVPRTIRSDNGSEFISKESKTALAAANINTSSLIRTCRHRMQ